MIPTVLYPRSWIVPKFISLVAYVLYICIIYNLYLFHSVYHIAQFLIQFLVLVRMIIIIVDDLMETELEERIENRKLKESSVKEVAPHKEAS